SVAAPGPAGGWATPVRRTVASAVDAPGFDSLFCGPLPAALPFSGAMRSASVSRRSIRVGAQPDARTKANSQNRRGVRINQGNSGNLGITPPIHASSPPSTCNALIEYIGLRGRDHEKRQPSDDVVGDGHRTSPGDREPPGGRGVRTPVTIGPSGP